MSRLTSHTCPERAGKGTIYPYLEAGRELARHDGAIAWLQSHGYRIADVSVAKIAPARAPKLAFF